MLRLLSCSLAVASSVATTTADAQGASLASAVEVPTCKAHKGTVWAMCGTHEVHEWGVGPEGEAQAIKNCNWTSTNKKKWGSCPARVSSTVLCHHTRCEKVDGHIHVKSTPHSLLEGNIATYDRIKAGTVVHERSHCMFYHDEGGGECKCYCTPQDSDVHVLGTDHAGVASANRALRPRDGGWGAWDSWSHCSAFSHTKDRSRRCDTPLPRGLGKVCDGSNYEQVQCTPP